MIRRAQLLLPFLCVASCGQLRPERMPYRFSAPMIESQSSRSVRPSRSRRRARKSKTKRPRLVSWRAQAVRRCQRLTSSKVVFNNDKELLRAVYGSRLPARIDWRSIKLRQKRPQLADLVVFDIGHGKVKIGVVTKQTGARIRFVHVVGGRGRFGWLHLQQPHRRRLSAAGPIANSYVRPRSPNDAATDRYLAGQLLSGFGTPPL